MGYGSFEGTGWFGDKTKVAVAALQKKAGISSPGAINAATWAAAWNPAYKKTAAKAKAPVAKRPAKYVPATDASCRVGSRTPLAWGGTVMVAGQTYRDLQCFQRQLGAAYGLTGTGFFGSHTRTAVASLQAKDHLPLTGKVDKATWDAAWARK
ncbi:MAG: peptidoglycan-binding protein [Actinomycetota bacterium]|nr:peptidoglycan-binding protein [Actinomycetota bacterium]